MERARSVMSSRLPMGVATIYNMRDPVRKEKVVPGFEPGMEALQASALPLGYTTLNEPLLLKGQKASR